MPRFGARTASRVTGITIRLFAALALTAVLIPTTPSPSSVVEARDAGQSIANSDRGVIPDIAAGGKHTCALDNTGEISCWGEGGKGQLGTGNSRNTPSDPITLPAGTTATAITTGNDHTCALLNTGQISCWGNGSNGRLGTGNTNQLNTPSTPIALPAGTTATAITAGSAHTCALLNTAQISCWGTGRDGQLGTGNTNQLNTPSTPIALPAGTTATAITAGGSHTCALLNTAQISCWGTGSTGRLGTGNTNQRNTPSDPITLPAGTTATAITAGSAQTCALLNTAQISCWGTGGSGRLGTGNNNQRNTPSDPITLPAGTTATAITTGSAHTCALLNTAQISCWGFGFNGQLGTGNNNQLNKPSDPIALPSVDPLRQTAAIAAGDFHTCALLNTAQISCWGTGFNGRLGTGNNNQLNTPSAPITLPAGTTATAITTGNSHTCALLNTAQISCWGHGFNGRLGTGNTNSLNTPSAPITLPAGTTATAITAGSAHTCALLNTAQISCWGFGGNGRLGTGNTNQLNTPSAPITLPAGTTATAITAGDDHTCALLNTGQISCWGHGSNGRLGTGNTNQLNTPSAPITLPAGTTATAITTGSSHTCALLNTGQISCWGTGSNGQLGTGNTNSLNTPSAPITLPAGTTATAITTGNSHTCALLNTAQISCWGYGDNGQLGTGNTNQLNTPSAPITLPAGTTATAITTGNSHTCALLNTGNITCWGGQNEGQLGTGNNNDQPSPTLVTFPQATPTLTLATGQTNPTNTTTINITATFDQPVTLTAADITLSGTAGATTATPTGSGTTWNIAITGTTSDGTVTITIPAGTASAFGNTASNTLTVDYDATGPIATVDLAPNQNAATTATPIVYTVTFDEPVTGFDTNDLTITGTAGATLTDATITGSGTNYTVTINQVPNPGTIILDITPGATTDALTNPSTTTITANTVTITDTTGPIINLPANMVVDTEPDAPTATVTYTATATDPDSNGGSDNTNSFAGTVTINCTPPSGSQFPIGTTTVTCTANDTTGNTTTATFTITVNAQTTPTTTPTTTTPATTTPETTTTTTTTPPATTTPATTTPPPTTTTPAATTAPTTTSPPPMSIDPNITLPATGNSSQQLKTTLLIGLLLTLGGIATTRTTRRP